MRNRGTRREGGYEGRRIRVNGERVREREGMVKRWNEVKRDTDIQPPYEPPWEGYRL
jgi:hypothetical protein